MEQPDEQGTKEIVLFKEWPESGNIATTQYDPEQLLLQVKFKSGAVYEYKDFPMDVWVELLQAPSIGSFINKRVKDYPYKRIA
jgi:hypothetical protein